MMFYTMYPIVRSVCKGLKMRVCEEDCEDFDLMWADHAIAIERMARFKPY